jgi:hypothetical protein
MGLRIALRPECFTYSVIAGQNECSERAAPYHNMANKAGRTTGGQYVCELLFSVVV